MQREALAHAIAEAERFVQLAKDLVSVEVAVRTGAHVTTIPVRAAVRRSSLDLSKALSALRVPQSKEESHYAVRLGRSRSGVR